MDRKLRIRRSRKGVEIRLSLCFSNSEKDFIETKSDDPDINFNSIRKLKGEDAILLRLRHFCYWAEIYALRNKKSWKEFLQRTMWVRQRVIENRKKKRVRNKRNSKRTKKG